MQLINGNRKKSIMKLFHLSAFTLVFEKVLAKNSISMTSAEFLTIVEMDFRGRNINDFQDVRLNSCQQHFRSP